MDETDHKHSHTYLQLGGYDHPPPSYPQQKLMTDGGWGEESLKASMVLHYGYLRTSATTITKCHWKCLFFAYILNVENIIC